MATKVRDDVDALAVANSDNMQWTISQIEVELLLLENALHRVTEDGELGLSNARKRFDIFYSRIATLRESPLYAELRAENSLQESLSEVWTFLQRAISLIDGPDAALIAASHSMAEQVTNLRPGLRAMSLRGITIFAAESDRQRERISRTLVMIAGLTFALVVALVALAAMLFRQYRNLQIQSRETQMTTSRLAAVITSSLDAVIVITRSGRIIEFNDAAEKTFGYTHEEALAGDLATLIIPEHYRNAHRDGMKRYLETGERRVVGKGRVQLEAKRKDGSIFPIEFSISSAKSDEGEIFVAYLRDISDRISAEEELLVARDDALAGEKAKAELLAVMSHEMRTPLNGMLGTLELLEETELGPRQKEYLEIIDTSGKMLLHHVNDVLDISRLDAGKTALDEKPLDLCELVAEVCESQEPLAKGNGTKLMKSCADPRGEMVLGDHVRLRQVLFNIVGNAVKFTRNGTVSIDMERPDDDDIVEIRIADTGIGIDEADLDRVFNDFVTLDSSYGRISAGTGLGLGICRRLVEAMGGQIGVESTKGEGTLFWVRLSLPCPASIASASYKSLSATDVAVEDAAEYVLNAPLDILVVEDNHINRLVVREMLEKEGHNVFEAHDGEEGVVSSSHRAFDLILMDISMPRMDGIQATQAIRGGDGPCKDIPIIALTAHALPEEVTKFRQAGMNETLTKPLSRNTLRTTLASVMSREHVRERIRETAVATFDVSVLEELRESIGHERLQELVDAFVREADESVAGLTGEGAMHLKDPEFVKSVHKIAGSAALFGASAFHGCLSEIEACLKAGQLDLAGQSVAALAETWATTRAEITAKRISDGQTTVL